MSEQKHRQCWKCRGHGEVRFLLFFKRDCPTCHGTGFVRVFPTVTFSRPLLTNYRRSLSNSFPPSPQPQPKPKKLVVPPSHHPANPQWRNNPMNPNSPLNPNNPLNPLSTRNPHNPHNPFNHNSPHHPLNRNNPIHRHRR